MYSLMTQQVRHLNQGVIKAGSLWWPPRKNQSIASSSQCHQWCFAFLGLWLHHSSLCLRCPVASPLGVRLPRRAAAIGFRAHPDPVFLHLNLMTSAKNPFLFFFFLPLCGMWDLSSLTRDWTHASWIGSAESYTLDLQGRELPLFLN